MYNKTVGLQGISPNVIQSNQYKTRRTGNDFSSYISEASSSQPSSQRVNYEDIFQRASLKYNVPVSMLKAVGKAESNFNANAVSGSGAEGVMQLMPKTARSLGVNNSFDPEQNIMGGAKYLSEKLDLYNGDIKLTLAAYNAGSGNVKKYGGIPPFKETQNYVQKVMGYMNEDIYVANSTYVPNVENKMSNFGNDYESYQSIADLIMSKGHSSEIGNIPFGSEFGQAMIEGLKDNTYTYDDYITFLRVVFDVNL